MGNVNELIQRFLGEPARNLIHAMYDDYVEANVRIRSLVGVRTFIIRRELAKCCEWCHSLAGIYKSGKAPYNIYQRHDNCRCMVTYRNEKGKYVDVWSKKEYYTQRNARIDNIGQIAKDTTTKTKDLKYYLNQGLKRAKEHSKGWGKHSLSEAIKKYAPNAEVTKTSKGKIVYTSEDGRFEIVYDIGGDYFRIWDNNQTGRKYVDFNGNSMNNITVNGKQRGLPVAEFNKLTHFKNTDRR